MVRGVRSQQEMLTWKIGQGSLAALSHGQFSSPCVAEPNTPPELHGEWENVPGFFRRLVTWLVQLPMRSRTQYTARIARGMKFETPHSSIL